MKYLRKFINIDEYRTVLQSEEYLQPNISLVGENKVIYNEEPDTYFYIKALETISVSFSVNTIQYSRDKINWVDLSADTPTPTITTGNKMYFKASGLTPTSSNGIGTFSMTGKCEVGGNIMSLVYGDEYKNNDAMSTYQFCKLFYDAINLISASLLKLPSVTSNYCYLSMFENASSLIDAPALPAKSIKTNCYMKMFKSCLSLETAPILPATTFQQNYSGEYYEMFYGCLKLSYIKMLVYLVGGMLSNHIDSWVSKVASEGTFIKNAKATWTTTGSSGVPKDWTVKLYDTDTDKYVIKLTIDDTSYMAEEGATWADWVASTYNTAEFTVSGTSILSSDGGTVVLSDVAVVSTDAITSGGVYTIQTATE